MKVKMPQTANKKRIVPFLWKRKRENDKMVFFLLIY